MNFLSQDWWWILLLIGVFLLLGRRGHHGLGGFGRGHHGNQTSHGGYRDDRDHAGHSARPTVAKDPLTPVAPEDRTVERPRRQHGGC